MAFQRFIPSPFLDEFVARSHHDPKIKNAIRQQICDPDRDAKSDLLLEISTLVKKIGNNIRLAICRRERELINHLRNILEKNNVKIIGYIFDSLIVSNSDRESVMKAICEFDNSNNFHTIRIKPWIKNNWTHIPLNHFDFLDPICITDLSSMQVKKFKSETEFLSGAYKILLKTVRTVDWRVFYTKKCERRVDVHKKLEYEFNINDKIQTTVNVMRRLAPLFNFNKVCSFPAPNAFHIFPGFLPDTTNVRRDYVNHCEPILHHIKAIWCDDDEKMYEFILDWFAYIVQKYPKVTETIIILTGDEGTGKSSLFDFIRNKIFGNTCLTITGCEKLTRNFNSHLQGKILVCLEELKSDTNSTLKHDLDRLKHICTSQTIDIEKKGIDVDSSEVNAVNILGFSNNNNPLPAVKGINRRLVMGHTSRRYQNDSKYFTKFIDFLENDPDIPACFLYYLQNRKIDMHRLKYDKPVTNEKILSQWTALSDVEKAIYYMFYKSPQGHSFTAKDMLKEIAIFSNFKWSPIAVGRYLCDLSIPFKRTTSLGKIYNLTPSNYKIDPLLLDCCIEFITENQIETVDLILSKS